MSCKLESVNVFPIIVSIRFPDQMPVDADCKIFLVRDDPSSLNVNYDTNFDAPDAHFDYASLFSGTWAEKVGKL
jgi:hypothetical protein